MSEPVEFMTDTSTPAQSPSLPPQSFVQRDIARIQLLVDDLNISGIGIAIAGEQKGESALVIQIGESRVTVDRRSVIRALDLFRP